MSVRVVLGGSPNIVLLGVCCSERAGRRALVRIERDHQIGSRARDHRARIDDAAVVVVVLLPSSAAVARQPALALAMPPWSLNES